MCFVACAWRERNYSIRLQPMLDDGTYRRINNLCEETRSSHDSWWGYLMMMPSSTWLMFVGLFFSFFFVLIVCNAMVWLLCELWAVICVFVCACFACSMRNSLGLSHFPCNLTLFRSNQSCSSANNFGEKENYQIDFASSNHRLGWSTLGMGSRAKKVG